MFSAGLKKEAIVFAADDSVRTQHSPPGRAVYPDAGTEVGLSSSCRPTLTRGSSKVYFVWQSHSGNLIDRWSHPCGATRVCFLTHDKSASLPLLLSSSCHFSALPFPPALFSALPLPPSPLSFPPVLLPLYPFPPRSKSPTQQHPNRGQKDDDDWAAMPTTCKPSGSASTSTSREPGVGEQLANTRLRCQWLADNGLAHTFVDVPGLCVVLMGMTDAIATDVETVVVVVVVVEEEEEEEEEEDSQR
nr:unnamed protein product [Spirometra erinaceieuropaei]